LWLIHASVRSTIQRLGRTTKRCGSLFDDLQLPATGLGDGCGRLGSLIASIGEDAFDEGE
jgi:hypothetical protein